MQNIYFIDIETVRESESIPYPSDLFLTYHKRFSHQIDDDNLTTDGHWKNTAGFYAEHAKVISVSIGFLTGEEFRVKTLTSCQEVPILQKLAEILTKARTLAGHNIKEFDIPFLMRRYIINNIPVPGILNVMDKKPWEIPFHDTMEMWGSTQWKYRVSLDLLATILGIPSPKKSLSGDQIAPLYYSIFKEGENMFGKEDQVLNQIKEYNAGDVVTNAKIYARLKGLPDLKDEQVKYF